MHDLLHTCIHRDGLVKDPNFSRVIFALRNGSKARLSRSGRHVYFNTNVRDRIIYCWLSVTNKLCTFDVSREYSYQQDILKAKLWVMWYFWPGHTEFILQMSYYSHKKLFHVTIILGYLLRLLLFVITFSCSLLVFSISACTFLVWFV